METTRAVRLSRTRGRAGAVVFSVCVSLLQNLFRDLDASLEEAAGTMGATPGQGVQHGHAPAAAAGRGEQCRAARSSYSFADLGNPLLLGGDFEVLSSAIYQTIIGMYDVPKAPRSP